MHYVWNVLFFYLLLQGIDCGPYEVKLIRKLLEDYVVEERPSKVDLEPLDVSFRVTLRSIIDVDEKNQMIHTNLWLYYAWVDYKLSWDPNDYGNVTEIRLPIKKVWKPDILMYNSADPAFDGSYPTNAVLKHTGELSQNPPGIFTSRCPIKIKWFPFDDQGCKLKFGSWTYDSSKINLKILDGAAGASLEGYTGSGEWDLVGFPSKLNTVKYEEYLYSYQDITYTIQIRRRKLSYVINIVTPCLMLAALTLVTFVIPPDAGEKISFGVTILLSLAVFLLMVAEELPANSDAVPLIALYFTSVMFLNAASVVFTVFVLSYHHRTSETHSMPKWVKKGICEWLAWILLIERPGHKMDPQVWCRWGKIGEDVEVSDDNCESLIPNESPEQTTPGPARLNAEDKLSAVKQKLTLDAALKDPTCHPRCEIRIRAIQKDLKFIVDKIKSQDEDDQVTSDWKFSAAVIDRFLLWFFTISTVLATVVILLGAPNLLNDIQPLGVPS